MKSKVLPPVLMLFQNFEMVSLLHIFSRKKNTKRETVINADVPQKVFVQSYLETFIHDHNQKT